MATAVTAVPITVRIMATMDTFRTLAATARIARTMAGTAMEMSIALPITVGITTTMAGAAGRSSLKENERPQDF
jgi:hypothetical protein